MCVDLRTKCIVSSIILTSLDRGGGEIILPPPPPQNEPLKSPSRLGLSGTQNPISQIVEVAPGTSNFLSFSSFILHFARSSYFTLHLL